MPEDKLSTHTETPFTGAVKIHLDNAMRLLDKGGKYFEDVLRTIIREIQLAIMAAKKTANTAVLIELVKLFCNKDIENLKKDQDLSPYQTISFYIAPTLFDLLKADKNISESPTQTANLEALNALIEELNALIEEHKKLEKQSKKEKCSRYAFRTSERSLNEEDSFIFFLPYILAYLCDFMVTYAIVIGFGVPLFLIPSSSGGLILLCLALACLGLFVGSAIGAGIFVLISTSLFMRRFARRRKHFASQIKDAFNLEKGSCDKLTIYEIQEQIEQLTIISRKEKSGRKYLIYDAYNQKDISHKDLQDIARRLIALIPNTFLGRRYGLEKIKNASIEQINEANDSEKLYKACDNIANTLSTLSKYSFIRKRLGISDISSSLHVLGRETQAPTKRNNYLNEVEDIKTISNSDKKIQQGLLEHTELIMARQGKISPTIQEKFNKDSLGNAAHSLDTKTKLGEYTKQFSFLSLNKAYDSQEKRLCEINKHLSHLKANENFGYNVAEVEEKRDAAEQIVKKLAEPHKNLASEIDKVILEVVTPEGRTLMAPPATPSLQS